MSDEPEFWEVTLEGQTLRDKILSLVRTLGAVSFAELAHTLGPQFRGDCTLWLDPERNLILWPGISEEAAGTILTLLEEGALVLRPSSPLTYLIDGMYPSLPVARGRYRYAKPHWVPVVFDVGGST